VVVGLGGACPRRGGGGVAGHGNPMDTATASIGIGMGREKWELAYSDGTAPLLLCLL